MPDYQLIPILSFEGVGMSVCVCVSSLLASTQVSPEAYGQQATSQVNITQIQVRVKF